MSVASLHPPLFQTQMDPFVVQLITVSPYELMNFGVCKFGISKFI